MDESITEQLLVSAEEASIQGVEVAVRRLMDLPSEERSSVEEAHDDFLEEIVRESEGENPTFRTKVAEALEQRRTDRASHKEL